MYHLITTKLLWHFCSFAYNFLALGRFWKLGDSTSWLFNLIRAVFLISDFHDIELLQFVVILDDWNAANTLIKIVRMSRLRGSDGRPWTLQREWKFADFVNQRCDRPAHTERCFESRGSVELWYDFERVIQFCAAAARVSAYDKMDLNNATYCK